MKKIGILFGKENTFPQAFVDAINAKNLKDIKAEAVEITSVEQGVPSGYSVIIDRISQDVPFYRAFLKNAALTGTAVINNPFWWSADEKFFNNAVAVQLGVPVPKTQLLPSHVFPPDTNDQSFRNLYPSYTWDANMNKVGFPAFMKPHAGGGWKHVYKLDTINDFHANHPQTGELCMLFQEAIDFTDYYRCYFVGGRIHIMPYEPRNPHQDRYKADHMSKDKGLLETIKNYVIALNEALGYDFNTVEFAVKDGIPYAIDFCNPAPDADRNSVGEENFAWIVKNAAEFAIERAKAQKDGQMNLTWGKVIQIGVSGGALSSVASVEKPKAKKVLAKTEEKPLEAATTSEETPKKRGGKTKKDV